MRGGISGSASTFSPCNPSRHSLVLRIQRTARMKTASESATVLLGYEIPTGEPVSVPIRHTVITGRTQESGKTTALSALISRSKRKALAFITKRSEKAFPSGTVIPPYFQERTDWRFVESILEAQMHEKMKYQRQWIVKVTEGATSLAEVNRNIQRRMAKVGPDSYAGGMYLLLSEYFKLLLPELSRIRLVSERLHLSPGLNLMDLRPYQDMQPLAIASSIEAAYHLDDVTVCLPEAWEFIPEERNTPVKMAATAFIKKAAGSGNFLWIDSQDLASVDKGVLKQVGVWILGVQGEINEVKHTLAQVALPPKQKPKPEEIQQLSVGQFYVCYGTVTKKVYVQPAWMDSETAIKIARGELPHTAANFRITLGPAPEPVGYAWYGGPDKVFGGITKTQNISELMAQEDTNVDYKAEYELTVVKLRSADSEIQELRTRLANLERRSGNAKPEYLEQPDDRIALPPKADSADATKAIRLEHHPGMPLDDVYDYICERLRVDKPLLALAMQVPEIEVRQERNVLAMDMKSLPGRVAALIARGFFDKPTSPADTIKEFTRIGQPTIHPRLSEAFTKLTGLGFLTKEENGYQAVEGMKVRIIET
jgi:hypothetical protein